MFFPSRREAVESLQGYAGEAVTRHRNALVQLPASRTENRAEGFGDAPMVADHPTDVFRMNSQFEDSHRLSLDREPALLRDGPEVSLRLPVVAPPGRRTANAWTPLLVRAMGQTEGENSRSH